MATITKSVSVSDICIKQTGSTAKTCSSAVLGDTAYVEDYSVEGTEGGTACCSSTTDLCMNAWIGCPLIFGSITWKETITIDGVNYKLKTATSGGSISTATYEQKAEQLSAPSISASDKTYNNLEILIVNNNNLDVVCYYLIDPTSIPTSASDIINTSHYTESVSALGYATVDIGWGAYDPTNIYACFVAKDQTTGYTNSSVAHVSFTRPTKTKLTAPTLTVVNNSYDSYSVKITNPNDVAVTFYSQDLSSGYGGSVDISANSSTEVDLDWSLTATSHTVKGYLSASGYNDSDNGSVTATRPSEPQYVLTVNYYVSGVASGTKYYDVGGSSVVYISTYKISITNATFSYSDPSSNFAMNNSNKTLNMYYIEKLKSPTFEEGNRDFYRYSVYVTNPNDVDCDFYSQDLIDDYGGSTIIEAGATKEIKLEWGSGSTSHTFSGYLSAPNYSNSTTNTIDIDRPEITSLTKPTLIVEDETTSGFNLRIYNTNEVEVKYYYGYTSSPTTYGGTISKETSDVIAVTKTTNKTMYVKLVYDTLSSQDSVTIPYLVPTTQLTAPTITLDSDKTSNTMYYYYIHNTNDENVSIYINGVQQSANLGGNEIKEYSGSWSGAQTSVTIVAKFGTLSSSFTDSDESTLTIDRPRIKLPTPKLTELTNIKTYSKYGFTYTNTSSLYSVQPFFNGSSQGDVLEPGGSRDYTFDWGTGETSKTFTCYAMPTGDTSQFTSSDSIQIKIDRPKTLNQPEITNVVQGDGAVVLTVYNSNDTSVLWFVDNAQQSSAIENLSTKEYTYKWGTDETEKTFSIKFKDPTGQYGDSNTLTKTIKKDTPSLLEPSLSSVVSQTGYSVSVLNLNEEPTVTYYVDGSSKGTIGYNETKTFSGEWAVGETSKTFLIKFTADNYEESSKSITVNRPGVITVAAPNLTLIENTTKTYKIRISNPNTTEGTYYLVDSDKAKIDDITLSEGEDCDYEKEWGEEETSKEFSCGLLLIVPNELDANNPTYIYSDIATLEEFNRPINVLEKPILSENTNNYETSTFNVQNTNEVAVTWLVNNAQQSTIIEKDKTATFSYDWQENEKTKRFTVKFTADNYDPSEDYIDLVRPNKLVEPIVELLVNSHDNYKVRIKNKNNVQVVLYDENGATSKTIAANGKTFIDGTWGTDTTKTYKYYFKADNYGSSAEVSITFNRINEDDYFTLYLNIDGTVYQIGKKYTLPVATESVLGGVKLGYTNSGKNYKVQKDSDGNIYVNVPWTDTVYSLPTASSSNKGGVKVTGNDGVAMEGEVLKAKVDNESIQVGTSGLETKIDGATIVKGTNGLESRQVSVTVNDTTKDILIEIK